MISPSFEVRQTTRRHPRPVSAQIVASVMGDWQHILEHGDVASFGGVGVLIAALLIIALRLLLPRDERRRIRVPLYLLLANVALVVFRALVPFPGASLQPPPIDAVHVAAAFFLLACIGRAGFLLAVDWLLGRRLARPLPKIFRDIIQVFVYISVAFSILPMVHVQPGQILTTSALLTAVIGLSLQETLGNLFAGLAIQAQHPFEIGDWIQFEIDEKLTGRVTEINWRATKVMTNDQVEVIIPNGTLAKAPIRNYTQPTRVSRRTVVVQGAYEAPPHEVHEALVEAVTGSPGVLTSPAPEVTLQSFADSGVEYWVRFFVEDYAHRHQIDGRVRSRIWYAFQRHGISIPFPIRDVRSRDMNIEEARDATEMLAERERALRTIDFLAGLPTEAMAHLTRRARSVPYAEGEKIIRQGDEGDELFIVHRGEVSVVLGTDSRVTEVARLGPGKFFGEMSLITGERRTATVRAIGPCELLVVGHEEMRELFEMVPDLAERISEVIARRQAQLDERNSRPGEAKAKVQEHSHMLLNRIKSFFSL